MARRIKKIAKKSRKIGQAAKGAKSKTRKHPRIVNSANAKAVHRALSAMEKAYQTLTVKGTAVLTLADHLGQAAVQKYTNDLIREMESEKFLRDILAMRDAFNGIPQGQLPAEVEPLRLLPEALIRWLEDRFNLTPYLSLNQELDVPVEKLSNFDVQGMPAEMPANSLVKIRVVMPGWKYAGKSIAAPQVKMIEERKT